MVCRPALWHCAMSIYYSDGLQVAVTLFLVAMAAIVALNQKPTMISIPIEAWIRFLLPSGDFAGVAVEGNALLRWMESNTAEHNVKGLIWCEELCGSTAATSAVRLGHDGIDAATGLEASGFVNLPPSWQWTDTKVRSDRSGKRARVVKVHFDGLIQSNIADVMLTFPIQDGSDDGIPFCAAFESIPGGEHLFPTNTLFARK